MSVHVKRKPKICTRYKAAYIAHHGFDPLNLETVGIVRCDEDKCQHWWRCEDLPGEGEKAVASVEKFYAERGMSDCIADDAPMPIHQKLSDGSYVRVDKGGNFTAIPPKKK